MKTESVLKCKSLYIHFIAKYPLFERLIIGWIATLISNYLLHSSIINFKKGHCKKDFSKANSCCIFPNKLKNIMYHHIDKLWLLMSVETAMNTLPELFIFKLSLQITIFLKEKCAHYYDTILFLTGKSEMWYLYRYLRKIFIYNNTFA